MSLEVTKTRKSFSEKAVKLRYQAVRQTYSMYYSLY